MRDADFFERRFGEKFGICLIVSGEGGTHSHAHLLTTHTQAAAAQLNAPRCRFENNGLIKREQREEYEHDDEETKSRRVARTRRKLEFVFQFPPKARLGNARDVGVDVFRRTNRRRENA